MAARRIHGDRADRLLAQLWATDPAADALVEAFATRPPGAGWREFEAALERARREPDWLADVPETPSLPEIGALLQTANRLPLWASDEVLERGGELLHRAGPASGLLLAIGSLVYGYASPAGNKPLVFAGGLTRRAARRLEETSRFVHAVCLPGGMRPGAEGWAITLRVRVMHASVRRLLMQRGDWDTAAWGAPINQHDMVATTQLFSTVLVRNLEAIGFRPTAEEAERYLGLWRWVGRAMGVAPDLLPASYRDGIALSELILATQAAPDEDSRALVDALFAAGPSDPDPEVQARLRKRLPVVIGLCRALLGRELADGLGLPDDRWQHVIHAVRAVVGPLEFAQRRSSRLRAELLARGRRHWTRGVERGMDAVYAPIERLAK